MFDDLFHKQPTLHGAPHSYSTQTNVPIPQLIGPYKIERLLAVGGMSILYLGVRPDTEESTAIKVLSSHFLSNPEVMQRFLNEAEIIATTNHPNIVRLYGHGEWKGGLYIAMEFVRGISIREMLLETPISLKEALRIVLDVAYALCHLHTHGVIHRDLKPENILITDEGHIKVIDFGIAQLLTEEESAQSPKQQRLIGTPIYMSPEQREDPESVSYPSDIYSLGIIMYELVLGKLSQGHVNLSLVPKGLQKILNKALQLNPNDRYQDVVDFITDVLNYLNSSLFQKEKSFGDQLADLLKDLRSAQGMLSPKLLPTWKGIEIGLKVHKGFSFYGNFYDFFSFPGSGYGIITVESGMKGGGGIIYTALLEGMVRSLWASTLHPVELVEKLNKLIMNQNTGQIFALNYLIVLPEENLLRHISCGYGDLVKVDFSNQTADRVNRENPFIGTSKETVFQEIVLPWEKGDFFVLSSCGPKDVQTGSVGAAGSDAFFTQIIKKKGVVPPQGFAEAALHKASIALFESFQERTISFIGVKR